MPHVERQVLRTRLDVQRHVRPQPVELRAADRGVVGDGRAGVAELRGGRRVGGEPVALGAHVDRLRQPRVGDRAVVALEVVLDADLPVRRECPRRAAAERERAEVDAALRDERRHLAEHVGKRRRVRVGVHEHERPPGVDGGGQEPELRGVEPRLAVAARDLPQRAVEVVRPRVVGALQRRAAARAGEHGMAAVAADVHERAQHAVVAAHHEQRHGTGVGGQVAAGRGDLVRPPRVLPAAPEDALLLAGEDLRVGVPARGQAVPGAEPVGDGVEGGGIVDDAHRGCGRYRSGRGVLGGWRPVRCVRVCLAA